LKDLMVRFFLLLLLLFTGCGKSIPSFNNDVAFEYLVKQCSFGPRVPNSEAHEQCERYLYSTLGQYADLVREQEFNYYDQDRGDMLHLTNIIASFNKDKPDRILLCAHWDSRPWADKDPDSTKHNQPVMGANDGASGTAVLLTLAEIFKHHPPPMGIDVILFDGEDYGDYNVQENWLLGSKYFVSHIGNYRPQYVLLLDMIGDADLDIHKDLNSYAYANWLVNRIWKAANATGAEHFYPDLKHSIYDDHVPFLEAGIPAAVIIDMDYKWWHTTNDLPENCSAESLGEVGRVVLKLLYDKGFQ
jgi:glutaminyl-peptide cyclotransferase